MGKKHNPLILQTSIIGKKLQTTESYAEDNDEPTKKKKKILAELVPSIIGTVQKNTKSIKNLIVRNKTALPNEPKNTNNVNLPVAKEMNKIKNSIVKFVPKTNNNKITTTKQIPSKISRQESDAKQTESNTVSDLSTQQSNYTTNVGAELSSTAVLQGSLAVLGN